MIAAVKEFHSLGTVGGHGEGHSAIEGDLLWRLQTQSPQHTGGAKQARGKDVGLLLGFGLGLKFVDPRVACVPEFVSQKDVAQLMGHRQTGIYHRASVVINDNPSVSVEVGFSVFSGKQLPHRGVADHTNTCCTGDLEHVNGQAVDMGAQQAEPSAVSDILINSVGHVGILQQRFVGFGGICNGVPTLLLHLDFAVGSIIL